MPNRYRSLTNYLSPQWSFAEYSHERTVTMPLDVIRHKLDPTGINPDNLVENEVVPVTTAPIDGNDLITPKFGYFFTDSVIIKIAGVDVPRDKYRFTEYFHKASLKYGKQICGSILVDVVGLSGSYDITYQALGGDTSRSAGNIIDVYYDRLIPTVPVNWDDLRDKPLRFKPKPDHQHNQSEIFDLGRILSYLENIREAITLVEFPEYNRLMQYINSVLDTIAEQSTIFLDNNLPVLIDKFKAQFTKEYFGLDNLVNMACSNNQDGYVAGKETYKHADIQVDKYMVLSSLVMFKEALYEGIVDRFNTNIGNSDLMYVSPVRSSLLNAPIGAISTYVGQDTALTYDIPFSNDLYPTGTIGRKQLTSVKITKHTDSNQDSATLDTEQGTLVLAYDHTADGLWLGSHKTNDVSDPFSWNQMLFGRTLQTLSLPIYEHIKDYGNSHKLTKTQVGLRYVENLPITPVDALRQLRSERNYLTFDQALKLMQMIETQDFWTVEQTDDRNRFLLDNCQVVYSGCGQCGCSDRSDFPISTSYVCRKGNGTYPADWPDEWKASTTAGDGSDPVYGDMWVITTNGGDGTVEKLFKANSLKCLVDVIIVTPRVYVVHNEVDDINILTAKYLDGKPVTEFEPFRDCDEYAVRYAAILPLLNGNVGFTLAGTGSFIRGGEYSTIVSGIMDSTGNLIDYTMNDPYSTENRLWGGSSEVFEFTTRPTLNYWYAVQVPVANGTAYGPRGLITRYGNDGYITPGWDDSTYSYTVYMEDGERIFDAQNLIVDVKNDILYVAFSRQNYYYGKHFTIRKYNTTTNERIDEDWEIELSFIKEVPNSRQSEIELAVDSNGNIFAYVNMQLISDYNITVNGVPIYYTGRNAPLLPIFKFKPTGVWDPTFDNEASDVIFSEYERAYGEDYNYLYNLNHISISNNDNITVTMTYGTDGIPDRDYARPGTWTFDQTCAIVSSPSENINWYYYYPLGVYGIDVFNANRYMVAGATAVDGSERYTNEVVIHTPDGEPVLDILDIETNGTSPIYVAISYANTAGGGEQEPEVPDNSLPVLVGEFCTRFNSWPPSGGYDSDMDVWEPANDTVNGNNNDYGQLFGVYKKGLGAEYTRLIEANSRKCILPEVLNPPDPVERLISEYCVGLTRFAYYSDGITDRYENLGETSSCNESNITDYPVLYCGSTVPEGMVLGKDNDTTAPYGQWWYIAAKSNFSNFWKPPSACTVAPSRTVACGEIEIFGDILPDPAHLKFNNFKSTGVCIVSKSSQNIGGLHIKGGPTWANTPFVAGIGTAKTRTFFLWQSPSLEKVSSRWGMSSGDTRQSPDDFIHPSNSPNDYAFNSLDFRIIRVVLTSKD